MRTSISNLRLILGYKRRACYPMARPLSMVVRVEGEVDKDAPTENGQAHDTSDNAEASGQYDDPPDHEQNYCRNRGNFKSLCIPGDVCVDAALIESVCA